MSHLLIVFLFQFIFSFKLSFFPLSTHLHILQHPNTTFFTHTHPQTPLSYPNTLTASSSSETHPNTPIDAFFQGVSVIDSLGAWLAFWLFLSPVFCLLPYFPSLRLTFCSSFFYLPLFASISLPFSRSYCCLRLRKAVYLNWFVGNSSKEPQVFFVLVEYLLNCLFIVYVCMLYRQIDMQTTGS